MARLDLTFDGKIIKEVPVGANGVAVGRSPDNDIVIDNLAVSNHHARITWEGEQLVVDDLQSLNGTFVNDMRVEHVTLHESDSIKIGKHSLLVNLTYVSDNPADSAPKTAAPKVDETLMLDTKQSRDLFQQAAAIGERAQISIGRTRVPLLVVSRGKTEQTDYRLINKLTVIGKSEMASVRLRGWFAPAVAAQIAHRDDGYYIGSGARIPLVNGSPISGQKKLAEGDAVEIGKFHFQFVYRD
jgi:pSer/pThr/pTyr-binding forkhead associated (FHA) protein